MYTIYKGHFLTNYTTILGRFPHAVKCSLKLDVENVKEYEEAGRCTFLNKTESFY